MKNRLIIIILCLFSVLQSCSEKIKEQSITEDIVSSLIDSVGVDSRLFIPPPPPNSTDYIRKIELWSKRRDSIKNDPSKVVIAVNTKIRYSERSNSEMLASFYGLKKLAQRNKTPSLKINPNNIEVEKFSIKSLDEFPSGMKIWNQKYQFYLSGVLELSRIEFDKSYSFGIAAGSFTCGGKCGRGFLVYLRKTKSGWQIDKIEDTWES